MKFKTLAVWVEFKVMWWMTLADKIIKNKSSTVNKDCKGTWQCNMTPGIWEREEGSEGKYMS